MSEPTEPDLLGMLEQNCEHGHDIDTCPDDCDPSLGVDPSRAAVGGDLSSVVVELPDDAVEAARVAVMCAARDAYLPLDQAAAIAVAAAEPFIAARVRAEAREAAQPAGNSQTVGELRLMVTLADNADDRVEWLNVLCAAVCAEAVAAERQRIASQINELSLLLNGTTIPKAPEQVRADAAQLAAGSVPVATSATCEHGHNGSHDLHPSPSEWSRCPGPVATPPDDPWVDVPAGVSTCPDCWTDGPNDELCPAHQAEYEADLARAAMLAGSGPVATPTVPDDPTHGRIDTDIQRAVDAMDPKSIGQRVAMEHTLQARRDAASPVPAEQPEER